MKNQKNQQTLEDIFEVLNRQNEKASTVSSASHSVPKFGSVQMIHDASSISKEEVLILEAVALMREEALSLLRKRNLNEGHNLLQEAEQLLKQENLSKEGALIATTYGFAANSFYSILQKDYAKSLSLMQAAMTSHEELFKDHGHPIELRRIHLGRNIAKIYSSSNDSESSMALTTALIKYTISSDPKQWPLDICKIDSPDKILDHQKMFLFNQLTGEVITLLSKKPSNSTVKHLESLIDFLENSDHNFQVISYWITAYLAKINKDETLFLEQTLCFMKAYKGYLPRAQNLLLYTLQEEFLS